MKKIFKTIVFLAVAVVVAFSYVNLKARWEAEERLAAINRSIDERIAWNAAQNVRRNEIATRLQQEALKDEAQAQARWDAAKDRGKLPGNNTEPGFTPAGQNAFKQTGTRY